MALTIRTGNIFTSSCQTLVNTINCAGVMGAGIALECRLRWPRMHERYLELCVAGKIQPGLLWLHKTPERWILNFPTKKHWRFPTQEQYLHTGLQKLTSSWQQRGITSIALPLLGADKGGLNSEQSIALMQQHLTDLPIPVEIYRYDPKAPDDLFLQLRRWMQTTDKRLVAEYANLRRNTLDKVLIAMERPEIRQLNQLAYVEGIGIKTLEKLFVAATSTQHENATPPNQLQLI